MLTIGNTTRTPTNTTGSFTSSSFPLKIETNGTITIINILTIINIKLFKKEYMLIIVESLKGIIFSKREINEGYLDFII